MHIVIEAPGKAQAAQRPTAAQPHSWSFRRLRLDAGSITTVHEGTNATGAVAIIESKRGTVYTVDAPPALVEEMVDYARAGGKTDLVLRPAPTSGEMGDIIAALRTEPGTDVWEVGPLGA